MRLVASLPRFFDNHNRPSLPSSGYPRRIDFLDYVTVQRHWVATASGSIIRHR
ncbi:hypothetical protein M6B38_188315 [Iris pallida]|uniref:Uncharacterized protein n=1 Tax=Iris pallida TaxID=29817 RepID=A0AAX6EH59_IRIPA|nr:hypothetical protein M6B38_188315 [Iris pallida]